jgi:hypothetical protein
MCGMSSVPGMRMSTLHTFLGDGGPSFGVDDDFRFCGRVLMFDEDGRLYHRT